MDTDFFGKDGECSEDYSRSGSVSRVSNWLFRCYVCQQWWNVFLVFAIFEFSLDFRLDHVIPSIFLYQFPTYKLYGNLATSGNVQAS